MLVAIGETLAGPGLRNKAAFFRRAKTFFLGFAKNKGKIRLSVTYL